MTQTSSPDRAAADAPHLRPAGRATRAAIEEAGRQLFAERGFEGTSVRAVAAQAGVDPALVIRHFGGKEALFLRCIGTSSGMRAVVDGPIEGMGRRLVAYFLDQSGTGLPRRYVALVQAAHRPQVREELHRQTAEGLIEPLVPRLTGELRELRVALMATQITGLLSRLYLQEDPVLAAAEPDDLVALYGDALQQLLTP